MIDAFLSEILLIFFSLSELDSCPRFAQEEAPVPRVAALETENESSDANLCRPHWLEGNESFDSLQAGHHHRSRIHDRSAREEDWTRHAYVDDANGNDGRSSGASHDLRTADHSRNT